MSISYPIVAFFVCLGLALTTFPTSALGASQLESWEFEDGVARSGDYIIQVRDENWESPSLQVEPYEYYVITFDARSAWDDYMTASWLPHEHFMRDRIHANRFGKQVAARLLARYLMK